MKYAVKHFEKRPGAVQRLDREALQQEISMLMSVNHPNMLCLKDTFDESDGVYLILELAPEGELFNWIIRHQKLSEEETRKVFIQLFEGLKYLVCRSSFVFHSTILVTMYMANGYRSMNEISFTVT